jgi:hypothetical protein
MNFIFLLDAFSWKTLQPTAGRRVILRFRMKQLSILAKLAPANGG